MMPMDISEILEKIDIWDAENVFHLKSDPSRLKKIINIRLQLDYNAKDKVMWRERSAIVWCR